MILLTKLNGKAFLLNADLIESVEETPDTVITLTNHNRFMVKEAVNDVLGRVIAYYRTLRAAPLESAQA